jgi:hypothetical protein
MPETMRVVKSRDNDSLYILEDGRPIATVWPAIDGPRTALTRQMAAAPLYFAACEWIATRLAETGESLADVRDVRISSLMLTQLMDAHELAKEGGAS